MKKSAPLLPLLAGLALGAGSAWALRQFTRPAAPTQATAASRPPSVLQPFSPSALLLLPPLLTASEADAALDAYLALPPLPAKATPSEITARTESLRSLLTVLPTPQFERLFAALATRLGETERGLRWIAFDVWLERDAPTAARWAAALVPGEAINASARSRYAGKALLAWADSDFPAAYAWATTLPDAKFSRGLASRLLAKLAATDPVQALSLAQSGGPELLLAAQDALFRAWSEHDPATAIRALGPTLLEANDNEWAVGQSLGKWIARDPQVALDWLGAQTRLGADKTNSLLRTMVWNAFGSDGKTDPRSLADALASRTDIPGRLSLISDLLGPWSANAPDAVLAWIDTLPDAAQRADLLDRATRSNFADHAERNLPLALHLPPGPSRDARVADTLANWAKTDPDAALAWLHDHDAPSLAGAAARVQGTLVGLLAATDPAAAIARWQTLPPGESRSAAVPDIATAWAKKDPAAASRWLIAQLPPQPKYPESPASLDAQARADLQRQGDIYNAQSSALATTVAAWLRNDPLGTLKWAESLPDSKTRQTALDALTSEDNDYEADIPDRSARADLFAQIKDPAARTRAVSDHVENWLRFDRPAAREWLETHDALTPEQAARILAKADPSHP